MKSKLYSVAIFYQTSKLKTKDNYKMSVGYYLTRDLEEAKDKLIAYVVKSDRKAYNFTVMGIEIKKEFVEKAFEAIHPFVPLTPVKK